MQHKRTIAISQLFLKLMPFVNVMIFPAVSALPWYFFSTKWHLFCYRALCGGVRHFVTLIVLACGMLFSSWIKACLSWMTIDGGIGGRLTCWSKLSQRCWIGFKSGLLAGQSLINASSFTLRKFTVSLAVWLVALSCWKRVILALF